MKTFYVYIVSSRTGTLYTGMTNNLVRRVYEHKHSLVPGFTAKYGCDRLMFYEQFPTALQAIAAAKWIKGWNRAKKVALVESKNPKWKDLGEDLSLCGPADGTVGIGLAATRDDQSCNGTSTESPRDEVAPDEAAAEESSKRYPPSS